MVTWTTRGSGPSPARRVLVPGLRRDDGDGFGHPRPLPARGYRVRGAARLRPQGSELHGAVGAQRGLGAGEGGGEHDGGGGQLVRAIPEFGFLGGEGDQADGGIIGRIPPGLGEGGEQLADLCPVVADAGLAEQRDVIAALGFGKAERNGGKALDLLDQGEGAGRVSGASALDVDEKPQRVGLAIGMRSQRPQALPLAIPGGEQAKADVSGQFPNPIRQLLRGFVVRFFVCHGATPCWCARETRGVGRGLPTMYLELGNSKQSFISKYPRAHSSLYSCV